MLLNKCIDARKDDTEMIPQREVNESLPEQASPTYGRYEGDQAYTRPHSGTVYEQTFREIPEGKVYPPQSDHLFMQFVIVFVISMVALFAFAVLCLVFVGGTAGWIGFIAASFAILCIASTFVGMNATKRMGGK